MVENDLNRVIWT